MSETYMITAKTVEEAIAIANREYADENHEVSYEIIDMPKKGFLGIGARDAKIKITVTESVSADLGSLVADLKSMKVLTSKGDSGEPRREKQPKQNQAKNNRRDEQPAQPKQNQNQQKQNQNQQKKNDQNKSEQGRNNQKNDTKPAQNSQKQNNQPKQNDKPAQQNKPKNDAGNAKKPAQPKADSAVKTEKIEKSEKIEKIQKTEAKVEVKADAVVKAEKVEKAEKTERNDKKQNTSSLRNQAKPGKRPMQKKHDPSEGEISASSTTVSSPVGLKDYVADENSSGFGSANSSNSSGRMSNDVRKKKNNKNNSAPANTNANTTPVSPLKPGKIYKNNSVIYEDRSSMSTRYDVAESEEDYKKLDHLEDRELTIDEIRASYKNTVKEADVAVNEAEAPAAETSVAPVKEKIRREAVSEAEMNFALDFANTLLRNMGLDASAVPSECPEGEEFDTTEECTVYPKINIIGDDTGILIGHHGETLDSIQYLVNLSAIRRSKQKDGDYVKIVVDVENYREKREETLRALARRMAARAVKYKRNVFLEPMNAYERRIIHSELQSFENVSTHSVGSDRDRKIIITYEGADKAPDNRRRGRKGNNGKPNMNYAEKAEKNENSEANQQNTSAQPKERRRPRKVQKMPIEKIGDILPDFEQSSEADANTQE